MPFRERRIGEREARRRVERILRERLFELLYGGGGIPLAREHVGQARGDVLPVRAPLLDPLELRDRPLPVVARQRAVEVDLGVGIELLDPRRDPVRLGDRALLIESLEVEP